MPYRFSYDHKALKLIKEKRKRNSKIADKVQNAFDLLKSDPFKNGERKNSPLDQYRAISDIGHHPEYRLIYRPYKCCITPKFCKTLPKINNCQGLIDIVYFDVRENADKLYNKNLKSRHIKL